MIKHLPFLVLTLFFLSCEKDDICIEGSEYTNRVTIGFVNYKNACNNIERTIAP